MSHLLSFCEVFLPPLEGGGGTPALDTVGGGKTRPPLGSPAAGGLLYAGKEETKRQGASDYHKQR